MYTKNDLKNQLKNMGLTGNETILIHSSMKSIGDVQDRAEGVLDVLIDYFKNGLLLFPTHTWKTITVKILCIIRMKRRRALEFLRIYL